MCLDGFGEVDMLMTVTMEGVEASCSALYFPQHNIYLEIGYTLRAGTGEGFGDYQNGFLLNHDIAQLCAQIAVAMTLDV